MRIKALLNLLELGAVSLMIAGCFMTTLTPYEEEVTPLTFEAIPQEEEEDPAEQVTYSEPLGARLTPREFTYEEAQMLMRIAESEAGNQGVDGMKMVMAVVLNRVQDKDYPDSIKDVIFQPHQFQPIQDGRYYKVEISPEAHKALAYVEQGYPLDDQIVAFEIAANKTLERYFTYAYTVGSHDFYITKGE